MYYIIDNNHCTSHTEIIYTDSKRVRIRRGTMHVITS